MLETVEALEELDAVQGVEALFFIKPSCVIPRLHIHVSTGVLLLFLLDVRSYYAISSAVLSSRCYLA